MPTITTQPTQVVGGESITVSGSGFAKNIKITLSVDVGATDFVFRAGTDGAFKVGILTGDNSTIGTHSVTAYDFKTKAELAKTTFQVIADPVPDPDPEPEPEPEPEPTPTGHIFGVDLKTRPTSGTAWTSLKTWADKTTLPDLRDQNNQGDIVALAKAMVFARTGDAKYKTDCITLLEAAKKTAGPGVSSGDALGMVRAMGAIALAAYLVDYRQASFVTWMRDMLTWKNPDRQYTIQTTQEKRPNNWGTHSGASRVAMALYLGDKAELDKAAKVWQGYLGNRSQWSEDSIGGFVYGDDLSWQADSGNPVGVNPKGATKNGTNIDGVMPDDMRRGGSFPTIGTDGKSYTWEGLQGIMLSGILLKAAGYTATSWSDEAIRRAYETGVRLAGNPSGDDTWQPYAMKYLYGRTASGSTSPGKGFGFTDWLYG